MTERAIPAEFDPIATDMLGVVEECLTETFDMLRADTALLLERHPDCPRDPDARVALRDAIFAEVMEKVLRAADMIP